MSARWMMLWALALVCWLGQAAPSEAHWADLAVAEVTASGTAADVVLTIPTGLVAPADTDHDGHLSVAEVASHRAYLIDRLGRGVALSSDGRPGTLTVAPSEAPGAPSLASGSGRSTTLRMHVTWNRPVHDLGLRYTLFAPDAPAARCLVTVTAGGRTQDVVLTPHQPTYGSAEAGFWRQAGSFVGLGIQHILTGYDHMLFLLSLLLLGGGLRAWLKVVTAFTVAHSITLSLAVFGVVSVPSRWVESAIALTIVYVAAENLWRREISGRWALTFAFGLIHGLGFASALRETQLPTANLAAALAGFNVGVELGQLMVVVIAYLALQAIQRQRWAPTFRLVASGGVVAIGLVWFIERAFFVG